MKQVFVSYSHRDSAWRERLFAPAVVTTFGECPVWCDAWLRAGDRWADEIDRRLHCCKVAVLLISPHFLRSAFIQTRELPRVFERRERDGLRVFWVPLGVTQDEVFRSVPALTDLQAARPVSEALPLHPSDWPDDRIDSVRLQLELELKRVLDPRGTELAELLAPRYALGLRLGEGSRATVYRAHDCNLDRPVAVKLFNDRDLRQREAFMADVRRSMRLSEEPNFLNLYDCGTGSPVAYSVLQLVEGRTLRERIDDLGPTRPLRVAALRRIFHRLTQAIARAHAINITYGNLKPANIVLDAEDEPFILPVGRRSDQPRDEQRLRRLLDRLATSGRAGEPTCPADAEELAYLVPDLFSDGAQPIDPMKVDQYMLGLIGWEMATGQSPLRVADPQALLEMGTAAFGPLPPAHEKRPLVPRRLDDMLATMTARRPRDRFADMQDVVRRLDEMPDIGLMIALDSWQRVMGQADFKDAFFERFYATFRDRAAESRVYFAGFSAADWQRQYRALHDAVMLLHAFHMHGADPAEPNVLSRIAASHARFPASLYEPFMEALIDTICGDAAHGIAPADPVAASPREAEALKDYWRASLEPGIDWLRRRSPR